MQQARKLAELETKQTALKATLARISNAIKALEEELAKESAPKKGVSKN